MLSQVSSLQVATHEVFQSHVRTVQLNHCYSNQGTGWPQLYSHAIVQSKDPRKHDYIQIVTYVDIYVMQQFSLTSSQHIHLPTHTWQPTLTCTALLIRTWKHMHLTCIQVSHMQCSYILDIIIKKSLYTLHKRADYIHQTIVIKLSESRKSHHEQ